MAMKEPADDVAYWLQEIKQARKREDKYRSVGRDILKIYHAEDEKLVPFNILFSNTETLLPALYSAQPRPVVQRRFQDDDPIGKLASEAGRRGLSYFLDTNRDGYETPHEAMESAVLDGVVTGRGMMALKFEADFRPLEERRTEDADSETTEDIGEPIEEAYNESICAESLIWDRVLIGYAKKWNKVPWIAYEFFLTKAEVAAILGGDEKAKRLASKLKYTGEKSDDDDDRDPEHDKKGQRKMAQIYQIWDKAGGKKVRYLAPSYKEGILKEEDDPLELTGFFNTPRPLQFIKKSSSLTPTAPYQYYKVQAEELNEVTRRINRITKAVKARALYDAQFGEDLERLMSKDDVTMVPIQTATSLASEKGVENAVWFYPVDVIVATLRELYTAREGLKQTIYEVTGISDILRGSTQASETATAQKIKNSWGTLRLKRGQGEAARYVRDILRMALELMATKFSEETWASMTGLPFLLQPKVQALQMQAQAIASQGQPVPPELQAQLSMPTWQQILELLRNDILRSYRIDIETNSTVEPEAAEDQEAIMKMLGAMGQAMNGIAPLVANGSMPFEVAKNIMLVVARRFRYGDQFEDAVNAMQPPKPPDQGAQQAEAAKKELDLQKKQQTSEIQFASQKGQMDVEKSKMAAEVELMKKEMALMQREMKLNAHEQQMNMQHEQRTQQFEMQKKSAEQEIGVKRDLQSMQEKKYNVENVVNKKTDTAMNQVSTAVKQVQALGESLKAVQQQAAETQQLLAQLIKATSAKRIKRPIRGKDGRIERVEEEMVA